MEPERWRRVEELYHAALEVATEERARFLKDTCGDDEALHHEVQSLLTHEGSVDGCRCTLEPSAASVLAP
jgi:hypothetical protein